MTQCYEFNYTSNQPQPLPNVWVPCPVGDNCCIGTDLCLSNNICHPLPSSKEKREASYSSYYNARCTDPTYTNPACDKICIGSPPDIVYNFTSNLWACCGNNTAGEVTCNTPLNEYYEAPAPNNLATLSSGAIAATTATLTPYTQATSTATISSNSSATSTESPVSSSEPSSAQADARSGGLSTGAEAGIGVGVALVVIALLVAIFLWLRRSKARRRSQEAQEWKKQSELATKSQGIAEMPVYGNERQELATNGSGTLIELSDDGTSAYGRGQDLQRRHLELPASV